MLVLLEMVYLLILAVGRANSLLPVADAFLEEDASAWTLQIGTVADTRALLQMLEVVRRSKTWRLAHQGGTHVLILAGNALVCHVRGRLAGLADSELEQLFDVLRGHFRRRALPNRNYLTFRIVM